MKKRNGKFPGETRVAHTDPLHGWLQSIGARVGLQLYRRAPVAPDRLEKPKGGFWIDSLNDSGGPFWAGVVCGHWLVGPQTTLGKRTVHMCISKCGVAETYEPWQIGSGRLPQTCYGCRPGNHRAPSFRTLPESQLHDLVIFWEDYAMATTFEERSNLRGDALKFWDELGRPLMSRICDSCGYGKHFGWKMNVRTCALKAYRKSAKDRIRVRAVYKSERRIELVAQPAGSTYEFEYDLSTGRTDHDFAVIAEKVKEVVNRICTKEEQVAMGETAPSAPAPELVAAAASSNGNGHAGPIDLAKLLKLQKNIETLMTVGKDVNELAAMKDLARKKVEDLNAQKGDLYVKLVEAKEFEKASAMKLAAAEERAQQCETSLRNAIAARDNTKAECYAKAEGLRDAAGAYGPIEAAAAAAEKELRELELLEADRLKSVGDAKGLSTLLEALAGMGG